MTKIHRQYGWLVLGVYLSLAAAVPMLTPAPSPPQDFAPPPLALLLAENPEHEMMMLPLRQQANAALLALQTARLHTSGL